MRTFRRDRRKLQESNADVAKSLGHAIRHLAAQESMEFSLGDRRRPEGPWLIHESANWLPDCRTSPNQEFSILPGSPGAEACSPHRGLT